MYGVFINCKKYPFINLILSGKKQYETRTKNVLSRLCGEKVALIETGKNGPIVRGYATIDYYKILFHDSIPARKSAWIFETCYDVPQGGKKSFIT